MKINHYLTVDRGTGPISLIHIDRENDEGEVMLRITHRAVFHKTAEVDAEATRAQLASTRMNSTDQTLPVALQECVSEEVAGWLTKHNTRIRSMRWKGGIEGVMLYTTEEELTYDAEMLKMTAVTEAGGEPAKPRRRMMMG